MFTELVLLSSWTCTCHTIFSLTEESCSGVVLKSVTIKGSCHGGDNTRFMHVQLRQSLACVSGNLFPLSCSFAGESFSFALIGVHLIS